MRQGQTLLDVALTAAGSAEAAWEIAERSGLGLTDSATGAELELPDVADADTVAELAAHGAMPATDGEVARTAHLPIGQLTIGKETIV